MNMKFLSEQTVGKLYDEGYDSIVKILTLTKSDLLKLDNFKETMANKIYETIPNPKDFGTLYRGLHVFGRRDLRPTSLAAMHVTIGNV